MKKLSHKDPKKSSRILTEFEEQSSFVQWFELKYPKIRLFAIPNGMKTSITQAVKAKREGMKTGVPDLYIPELKLFIEMKRSKNGVISPSQKDWIDYINNQCGQKAIVAHGCLDAVTQVQQHIDAIKTGREN